MYSCKRSLFFDGTILEKWTERMENVELLSSTKHQPKADHWKVNKIFDQFCFTGFSILTTLSSQIKDLLEIYSKKNSFSHSQHDIPVSVIFGQVFLEACLFELHCLLIINASTVLDLVCIISVELLLWLVRIINFTLHWAASSKSGSLPSTLCL